ncbi:MAG: hypothetical protein KDA89_23760, partial [Planctomycetaceae bacterium]|nr:hypothetical protein [Planctomycetaceae bacterium]
DDNPRLLPALLDLAVNAPNAPPEAGDAISLTELDGQPALRIVLPEPVTQALSEKSGLRITHVVLTHSNSCLWFSAGGEQCGEILRTSTARLGESGLAARAPLFTFDLDVEQWLSLPQDDAAGVGGLLLWMDANNHFFPPSPVTVAMMQQMAGISEKPTPLLQRVLDLGGDRMFQANLISDDGGMRLKLKIGEAVANYYVARMIDSQDRMMRRMQQANPQPRPAAQPQSKPADPQPSSE